MACKARQYSDQMACGTCGLAWDVNDPDPPQCGLAAKENPQYNVDSPKPKEDPRTVLQRLKGMLKP